MRTLKFSRVFNYEGYLRFLREATQNNDDAELEIDLGGVFFAHPHGMAPLETTSRHLYEAGWEIRVAYPRERALQNYFDSVGWGAAIQGLDSDEAPLGSSYLPLTSYDDYRSLNRIEPPWVQ